MSLKEVGFLGLGTMGTTMAAKLLHMGIPVWVWSRSSTKVFLRSRKASPAQRQRSAGALPVYVAAAMPQNVDLPVVFPKNRKKPSAASRRKPAVMTKRKGRRLDPTRRPPANGMLVRGLIPIAHQVMEAKAVLKEGLSLLLKVIPVVRCRFCSDLHVSSAGHNLQTCLGPQKERRQSRHDWVKASIDDILIPVEAYHLEDRLAPPLGHDQRFDADRISAVDELCIQAGYEDPSYPTKRYAAPAVKPINEASVENSNAKGAHEPANPIQERNLREGVGNEREEGLEIVESQGSLALDYDEAGGYDSSVEDENASEEDVEVEGEVGDEELLEISSPADDGADAEISSSGGSGLAVALLTAEDDLQTVAEKTLCAWQTMRSGVRRLKRRYRTLACGYCPEVHVGPKGHRARVCGAFKHQQRDGRHGWQSATVDELIPLQYVWHMRDRHGPPLVNALRAFYGQAPAVVEICVQAGFPIPDSHKPMMRLDIAIPELHELDKVL